MNQVQAVAEQVINVPVAQVRAAVADYAGVRGKILTSHYRDYAVRSGGAGAGTVVHWTLQATEKRVRDCLVEVSEPQPDVLVESDRNSTLISTWTVQGSDGSSTVRVVTTWEGANGIGGFFERIFAPAGLRRIHGELLANLKRELEG
ncbi:MAG TPA: SRPBCC family protein [Actinokineospora sp.]|jgi:hypothetical protein|nr:SRPBCC family protein [Actinokineospora sp.]